MKSLFSKVCCLLIVASFAVSLNSCYAGSLHEKFKTEKTVKAETQPVNIVNQVMNVKAVYLAVAAIYRELSPGEVTASFKISAPVYTAYVWLNEPKPDNINYQLIRQHTLGLIHAQLNV